MSANKYNGEVSIRLDKVRTLRFTTNSLAKLEEVLGLSSFVTLRLDPVSLAFGARTLRALLWTGLLHEDPELSLERAGDLIEMADGEDDTERHRNVAEAATKAFFYRAAPKSQREGLHKRLNAVLDDWIRGGGESAESSASATSDTTPSELESVSVSSGV